MSRIHYWWLKEAHLTYEIYARSSTHKQRVRLVSKDALKVC